MRRSQMMGSSYIGDDIPGFGMHISMKMRRSRMMGRLSAMMFTILILEQIKTRKSQLLIYLAGEKWSTPLSHLSPQPS
ncbi:hypothetical protein ACS0TY_022336 [Phlomoides rotata]